MRWMMDSGSTLRSAAANWPREPAGDRRRPFSSSSVRLAPRPRSDKVLAPGPFSVTKPVVWSLICCEPEASVEDCRISAADIRPSSEVCSVVMICTGEAAVNSVRRRREPVTTTSATSWSLAFSAAFGVVVAAACSSAGAALAAAEARTARMHAPSTVAWG